MSRGPLDSPWGLASAPRHFGRFGRDLLVGNFGDGKIHASTASGKFEGTLHNRHHTAIVIDGLWALRFGNSLAGPHHTLLFSAGPDDESHGLLGAIHHVGH